MGVYLSPWDRNHPAYGTPEYNQVFAHMLTEVLTHYGPTFEVWFDGANGEGPNGKKQVYDWNLFIQTVRKCQPNAVIFSDAGPDVRWIGNEDGKAEETNWCTVDRSRYVPGTPLYRELTEGKMGGTDWVPAECDVSIRPGWFYHASQDAQVKTADQLEEIWYRSVGQNANLILNVPPNRDGRIHENDIAALSALKQRLDRTFKTDLAPKLGRQTVAFDRIWLEEKVELGQRVKRFHIEAELNGKWQTIASGTTIGFRRILRVPFTKARDVRVVIDDALAPPQLLPIRIYNSQS
jgi:alpha-L-fucosidase